MFSFHDWPCVRVAGDLNQKYVRSNVVHVLSTSLARALLGLIRWSPKLNIFENVLDTRLNVFLKQ